MEKSLPEPPIDGPEIDGEHGPVAEPKPHRRRLPISHAVWIPLVLCGGVLLSVANETTDAITVSMLFLVAGWSLNRLFFPRFREERMAFLLSFSICVFVAGLAQLYMKSYFGSPVGVSDATSFYARIYTSPPYYSIYELDTVAEHGEYIGKGAPLAIYFWQRIYHVLTSIGFDFGVYIGVLTNALFVGLTASLTVNATRILFGQDTWRLRRTSVFFALCGMFWLFGAILLRDCFTLFVNTVALWGMLRALKQPRIQNFLLSGGLMALSCLALYYLRKKSIILIGLFGFLAFFCWYWRGPRSTLRSLAALTIPFILLIGSSYIIQYVGTSAEYASYAKERYEGYRDDSAREGSLAMALVVNQPTPIRAVLGTGVMLVYPIPLWSYLKVGATEYELIKSWQGFYLLLLFPLVLVGSVGIIKNIVRRNKYASAHLFLLLYVGFSGIIVAVSSMETRHLGQFMPALILLAILPDTRNRRVRAQWHTMAFLWFGAVAGVHLAWATMRFM